MREAAAQGQDDALHASGLWHSISLKNRLGWKSLSGHWVIESSHSPSIARLP